MNLVRDFVNTMVEMLREIFDENAYARYLARESKLASVAAYAEFVEQRSKTPVKRCC